MDIKSKFGERVKMIRKDKKLSQEALASLSDIERTYMCSIEKGERNVSISIIEKLAKAFNISIENLMKGL